MGENIRLGRIAGIPVGINWSILVIFCLLTLGCPELSGSGSIRVLPERTGNG